MDFIKDLFTWRGRWNRLKFWIYPLVSIVLILPILGTIAFLSLQGYSEEARNMKVYTDVSTLSRTIEMKSIEGIEISSLIKENNKINFMLLGLPEGDFKMPNGGDYLLFVKDYEYQIYGETSSELIIKGNYYQKDDNNPISLVLIDGKYKQDGDLIENNSKSSGNSIFVPILSIFAGLMYLVVIWISTVAYIKRLHDLDHSGWLVLIAFVPFVSIGLIIYCGFFKGTSGDNKFGPNPLGGTSNNTINSTPNEL